MTPINKISKAAKKNSSSGEGGSSKSARQALPVKKERQLPQLKDFTYAEFRKIADKAPITQLEWAAILHLSERTLQRYAKNNSTFAHINAERALQVEKLLKEGKAAFGNTANFYEWLKSNPPALEGELAFNSLYSFDGIEKVLTQLGRIQHGLFT